MLDEIACFQITIKPHQLSVVVEVQPARVIRQRTVEGDLRQLVVRRDLGNGGHLIGLRVQLGGVSIAAIADRALLVQEVAAIYTNLFTFEVLEVIRVADLGVVNFGQYA